MRRPHAGTSGLMDPEVRAPRVGSTAGGAQLNSRKDVVAGTQALSHPLAARSRCTNTVTPTPHKINPSRSLVKCSPKFFLTARLWKELETEIQKCEGRG